MCKVSALLTDILLLPRLFLEGGGGGARALSANTEQPARALLPHSHLAP